MNLHSDKRFGAHPAETFARRLAEINERMEAACIESGRDARSVRLLPVTKTVPSRILRHAFDAGLRRFAENKVQEARRKADSLSDLPVRWSMVGHLQTNKAKDLVGFATEFHALDSIRLADRLEQRLKAEGRTMQVYIQVNTSGEPSKYGIRPDELPSFLDRVSEHEHLKPRGLMTLALFSDDRVRVRACFELLRRLRDGQIGRHPEIQKLSMGMTNDFEDAIREGSNVVRIGQGIFGERPTPDGHYWPGTA